MRIDLHTHSVHSDGTASPAEVVRRAFEKGVRLMILTDHDCVSGFPEARAAAERIGMRVLCGVEINTREDDLHILGYGIDWESAPLLARLEDYRGRRLRRIETVVENLRQAGVDIAFSDIRFVSKESLGRPHVADALRRKGLVRSRKEAFERYLLRGKPGFAEPMGPTAQEAIDTIRLAGGMACVAHPGTIFDLGDFKRFAASGLEGVEVYYPTHSSGTVRGLLQIAQAAGLIPTGGSDFHGPGTGRDKIGGFEATEELWARLEPRLTVRAKSEGLSS